MIQIPVQLIKDNQKPIYEVPDTESQFGVKVQGGLNFSLKVIPKVQLKQVLSRGTVPVTQQLQFTLVAAFQTPHFKFSLYKHLFKSCLFCQRLIKRVFMPPPLKLLFLVSEYLLFAGEGESSYH